MAGVFRTIEIKWHGKAYQCAPTMAVVRQCELQGMRLTHLMQSFVAGQPQIGMASLLIALMLRNAGASATDDEVGAVLLNSDKETVMAIVEPVVSAFVWEPDEKKPEALSAA